MPTAVVVGAGPGIGKSVADRFAREGFAVAVLARSEETLASVREELEGRGRKVLALRADSTDEEGLHAALDTVAERLGPIDVLVYNAALIRPDRPGELNAKGQLDAWAVNVVGALSAATHVAPGMVERGRGSIIVTGGMPKPNPALISLGLGKFGVRNLVALLDAEYGPSGVHVASVTVPRRVIKGTDHDPDLISEHYWNLHLQPREEWQQEVLHGGDAA
ncbi:SDR family NAD(P)-dependent oxidoreductase [Streptomyces sp. NBRC 109706]|uniref:SDR family NAD(P)-dependent oxidoreductase n=1 Tax=Streptomyces sp. NBRC 109706 TaxID=1550035 RepID=UPI000A92D769|nr:SDR family NAD(P)-dependent oxidoreductase [Streptomyces sp. NBRC 109706]